MVFLFLINLNKLIRYRSSFSNEQPTCLKSGKKLQPNIFVDIIGWVGFTLPFVSEKIRHKFVQMSHISTNFSAECDPLT